MAVPTVKEIKAELTKLRSLRKRIGRMFGYNDSLLIEIADAMQHLNEMLKRVQANRIEYAVTAELVKSNRMTT